MTHCDAAVAVLTRKADALGRLSYRLASEGRPEAARYVRSLRATQYARIRALTPCPT